MLSSVTLDQVHKEAEMATTISIVSKIKSYNHIYVLYMSYICLSQMLPSCEGAMRAGCSPLKINLYIVLHSDVWKWDILDLLRREYNEIHFVSVLSGLGFTPLLLHTRCSQWHRGDT